ncbi:MAG: PD-(D/E)XK nuclease family protein [Microgenomates group bacterium]
MDKFTAVWLSHSSISNFKHCPRAYYLASIYRDPITGHKVSLITPSMSLGSAVHEVLESLSVLPTADRFKVSLIEKFAKIWPKFHGQLGGFDSQEAEDNYKHRGEDMLRRVMEHPGPLSAKAVKIKMDLPYYWISEEDNLILCGKLDWLEYDESDDSVSIIDFKTGVGEESVDSLQLPIYYLLAHNCQTHQVKKASYWYIGRDDLPVSKSLPDLDKSKELVLKIGKEIKLARSLERFKCPEGESGCKHCLPLEKILRGESVFVGTGDYGTDLYANFDNSATPSSQIL